MKGRKLPAVLGLVLALYFIRSPAQVKTDNSIAMDDGVALDATIIRPSGPPPSGGFPGVVLVHGYGGNKENMLPAAYLIAARGYASIAYSVRGQGNSGGYSTTDAERERKDLLAVIQYFRTVGDIDPDNLGVGGGSQGGIHAWMAAVYRMPGVRAVAAFLATPDFAHSLVANGCVRYALPMEMSLSTVRYAPDRDRVRGFIIEDRYDSVLKYINARDLAPLVDSVQVPVLQELGWGDFIFPANGGIHAAARLNARGVPVWSYYGTNGHGEPVDEAVAAFQLQTTLRWFDAWLKGASLEKDSLFVAYYADDRPGWPQRTTTTWPPSPSQNVRFYMTSAGLSTSAPATDEAFRFTLRYNSTYSAQQAWNDLYGGRQFVDAFTSSPVRMLTSPLTESIEVTGIPAGRVYVESDAAKFQAHVRIYDVADTTWKLISRAVNGIRDNTPGEVREVNIEATGLSHIVPAGHRLGVEVASLDMLRPDQANTVPYFQSSSSMLHASPSAPSYIDIPVVGTTPAIASADEQQGAPRKFGLSQNWPNPFNPATSIAYTVDSRQVTVDSRVKLTVYDLLGREVAVLVNEQQAPGRYTVRFDGSRLASGMYLYRLQAGSYVETKRMLLLK